MQDTLTTFSKIKRFIRKIYFSLILLPLFTVDLLLSKLKWNNKKVLASYLFKSKPEKKYLCIFSHFDRDNLVDDYVLHYLKELYEANCDIIFVTTSRYLSANERKKLKPFCHKVILKKNSGRDFGAFKCGIEEANDLNAYDKVILANDSVYGPFYPLTDIIHHGDHLNLDLWGATDSFEFFYHVQSYFIVFNKHLIQSESFKHFWQSIQELYSRKNVIYRYEIGMSQFFIKQGFKLGAYISYTQFNSLLLDKKSEFHKLQKKTSNPTHLFWDLLIKNHRYPFIKKELLSLNPKKLHIENWYNLLKQYTFYHPDLIQNHLNRLSGLPILQSRESL